MEKLERPIIVPWDFSQVAENAFQHAVFISRILNRDILLLHIVAEKKDVEPKRVEMRSSADKLGKEYGKTPFAEVVDGSIFKSIGMVANDMKAEMIIMGTHGMKGAQKLFGSKALKVVVSSPIPFLVIQDKPRKETFDTILLPIDFKQENKEKANWIYYLSRNFGSKFVILKSKSRDKGF
ncbi:MAG: universal stress protein, partial [Bacteroidetes bacterium]